MQNEIKTKAKEILETAADVERTSIVIMIQKEMNAELKQFGGEPSQRFFHLEGIKKMIENKKHLKP